MTRSPVSLQRAMVVAGLVAVLAAALGSGVRSTFGGQAAVDEPQYLLTALSLWEDRSLDISDELAQQRWRDYHDAELPVQTEVQPDGSQVSPHDPLLPILLAAPVGLAGEHGWLAARLTLALLAGLIAALTVWVAVRRFDVRPGLAGAGVAVLAASPPLAVYGQQVYPELPAAGVVLAVVAAGTGALDRRALAVAVSGLVALPWLSVKYVPVAAVLALLLLWRLARRGRAVATLAVTGLLSLAAVANLALHQVLWGGLTVYASGDHFAETGELSVMGVEPDYAGRSLRLVALMVDRGYGLAAWAPVWLLAVVGTAALLRRRAPHAGWLIGPLLTGWAVATWAAFTMHGFWWPGRQVVVVLPLAAVVILWWLDALAGVRARALAAVLGAVGVVATATLLFDGWARELTWVSGFERVDNPLYQAGRALLPDYRDLGPGGWARHLAWILALAGLALAGWRSARPPAPGGEEPSRPTVSAHDHLGVRVP